MNCHAQIWNVSPLLDSQFRIVPGLANRTGYVSFESVNYPGHYLRHSGTQIRLDPVDGGDVTEPLGQPHELDRGPPPHRGAS